MSEDPSVSKLFTRDDEDAEELFLILQGDNRISRNVRAKWFFNHLGRVVNVGEAADEKDVIQVVGAVPKLELETRTGYRVSKNTTLTYFSNSYRLVFVLDLSPSAFAADEYGYICYMRIFKIVEKCLKNLVKIFVFPGGKLAFQPQIFATFCAFSPLLCFPDDSILLQGILINEDNVRSVLLNLRQKFDHYINNLCTYFQPFIRDWSVQRRKFRCVVRDIESAIYASNPDSSRRSSMHDIDKLISDFNFEISDNSCSGIIQPDWALISMIRMGILSMQMLWPENAHSHLVLVTDGCCAIPEHSVLDRIIAQLRGYTITCSFIQSDSSIKGAALGHVSFPELFKFIATATFGHFVIADELCDVEPGQLNFYHRTLLSWNFQKAHMVIDKPPTPDFFQNHLSTVRSHQHSQRYKTNINKLLYMRMREGYTIRDVNHFVRGGKNMVKIFLTLLWKPNVSIEYVIVAPWRKSFEKICNVSVEFYVQSAASNNLYVIASKSKETLQQTMESMVQMDNLLVQMQTFNLYPTYYKIPRDLDQKMPFFELRNGKIYIANIFNKPKYEEFAQFWLPVCVINESMWRKWVHIHTLRIVLVEDNPMPRHIFTVSNLTNEFDQIQCREAGRQVLELFCRRSTFVLLKDQCFVNMLFTREQSLPQYFYVTRIQYDSPCMIIKLIFLGSMSGVKRLQVVKQLRDDLTSLSMVRSTNVFVKADDSMSSLSSNRHQKDSPVVERQTQETIVNLVKPLERPVERILVRYTKVPTDVANIVRLESTSDELKIREMILHNVVAKYLSCRRTIWELKPTFPRLQVSNPTIEFILQVIVKRRLQQGFNIAYGAKGIVNMVREISLPNRVGTPRIQQYVIFGPIQTDTDLLPLVGSYDSANDFPDYVDVLKRADVRRRPKSWPRLATEVWLEPQSSLKDVSNMSDDDSTSDHPQTSFDPEQATREQLLKEDDVIIRSIFTFDQLMRAAESGMHAEEAYVLNKVASMMTRESLSGSVYSYKDVFDPKVLMESADTREFMLLPALGYSESEDSVRVDTRLESLLKYVQAELMKYCDCCVDALDDAFLWDIVETCEDHFGISRFFAPDDWSFDNELPDKKDKHERRQIGAKFLIQSMNERDMLRKSALSDGSSVESTCSDITYSTKNAMSGGPNSPSEFAYDEVDERMYHTRSYDVSPLSRSITAFCGDNDPYSVAEEAAVAALNNLEAKLENIQLRGNSVPGVVSDSEESAPPKETLDCLNKDTNVDTSSSQTHSSSSFVTKELLNEIDQLIAFSSSSVFDMAHHSLSSSVLSTKSDNGNQKEELSKTESKRLDDKQALNTKTGEVKKLSDRSRNASGVTDKKTLYEEGTLDDLFRSEKQRHAQFQSDIHTKNEEKEEAIKKFPPIPLGGFGLYARRIGSHRMILFFVPKNAKTVRLLMPHCVNSFPVFVYFVDKLRMAQRFVEKGCGHSDNYGAADRGIRTIVEDFTQKARISTLAFLNRQLHERFAAQCTQRFVDEEPSPLDEFYLRALDSQLRAELEPTKFQLSSFNLKTYAEKVFEEYMFTKAFIAAAFSSIGQSVYVPRAVLQEAAEYRCEHISLELGSIHSILQNSCLHLQLYEQLPNRLTSSAYKLDPLTVDPIPSPKAMRQLNARQFFRLANGCVSNFNDFAVCFDRLLQAHSFKPVPGLPDYYFFWPYRKTVLRFANVDDVSTEFADVFRAIGDHQTLTYELSLPNKYGKLTNETRQRSESGSKILAEAGNATQLSPADMWPLFVQFSVAVIGPDGEMSTAPFSTIPNCLKQLTKVCSTRALQLQTEGLTGQSMKIAVDLYILTWPLPQQSPFRIVDPHMVYARYQETQAQLATFHKYPAKRREWILKMSEKQRRRLRREASWSSDENEGVDVWMVGRNLDQSDEDNSDYESSSISEHDEELLNQKDLLTQDSDELLDSKCCSAHNRANSEIRREEHSKYVYNFLAQLPKIELHEVKRLQASVRRMLIAERLFEWARKCEGDNTPQPTFRLLSTVCQFVSRIAPPDALQQITTNVCPEAIYNSFKRSIVFTGDYIDGVKRLYDRLTDLRVEYVQLRRFDPNTEFIDDFALYDDEDKQLQAFINSSTFGKSADKYSTLFYACFVNDAERFKEFHSNQMLTVDNPMDAYKEPPATPPPVSGGSQSSPNSITPGGALTPQRLRRLRASSLSPTLRKRSLAIRSVDFSSSDFDSSSGDDTFDTFEPLKDTPNDRLSSSSDPTSQSMYRQNRLRRQFSRHHSSSNDSLHDFCSDGETSSFSGHLKRRRSPAKLFAKLRSKASEVIAGSEDTIVAVDQVFGGEHAPSLPTKCVNEEKPEEMRNGFPLKWLISSGVYKNNENAYMRKLEPFFHDFWLIFHVEHPKGASRDNPQVTVYFLRRHNSPHTQLIRDALRVLDEQIHIVNQQLLLDRLYVNEECDQLLIDSPNPFNESKPIHRRITFYVMDTKSGRMLSKEVPCADESERQRRETSTFGSEEESNLDSALMQQARVKFSPGHFACDAVWFHWFEIHPRLQPASRFASGSVDWGMRTLQLGLERFLIKNRTNLYVFREQKTGNVVYLRLFPNEPLVLKQFEEFPYKTRPEPPPDSRLNSHVLLAVHGVEKPSDEITDLLCNMLIKKLNMRILSEIQDVLLKNAQVRLELSDVRFIQQDERHPTKVFYYALPSAVEQLLQPLRYYFEQQALQFCTVPHVREQSGISLSGSTTPTLRSGPALSRSQNSSKLHQSVSSSCTHKDQSFSSYLASGAPSNPPHYVPLFFLLNRPPSEGQRNIGLACIETKIVDTDLMPIGRSFLNASSNNYQQISRQLQQYMLATNLDSQKRLELFQSLTRVRRIKSPYTNVEKLKESKSTAFIQLAIWQNGKLDIKELDLQFQFCIQQALCDLYIEFGLLSMQIFYTIKPSKPSPNKCPTSPSSSFVPNTLQSQTSIELTWSRSEPTHLNETFLKSTDTEKLLSVHSSDMDLYAAANACHAPHEDSLPTTKQSVRPTSGTFSLRSAKSDKNLKITTSIDELIPSSTAMRPTRIASVGAQASTLVYAAAASALSKRPTVGRNKSEHFVSMSTPFGVQFTSESPPPVNVETGEYLRDEFALSAANWLDFVASNMPGKIQPLQTLSTPATLPLLNQCVLKRCTFALDCDRAMRKVMQVVFDRLCLGLLGERCVCMCRSAASVESPRRLQLLWNAASLSENTEKDHGRILNIPFEGVNDLDTDADEPDIDIALLAYNEKEYEDSLRYVQSQERARMPESLVKLCNPASREAQLQLYPPNQKPFIPRKRLLYVIARNETLTLFLYNYSIEICDMAREIVERTVLWHNARSRLLCDIGLHKLGITHLSTLRDSTTTANSYLLLTWMDPETLIRHDFPPDDLKMPDFSRVPRKYAQLLFKLYRFAEPAFVAKNFALDPFDDQTQQMLTLREDVKAKLNDHRLFSEVHRRLSKGETNIHEEILQRITSRSHHAHYVQSPLLLFTSWRYRIATIRNNIGNHEEYAVKGQVADGGFKSTASSDNSKPIELSPAPSDRKKRPSSHSQHVLSSSAKASEPSSVKLLPQLLPSICGGVKMRSKTTHGTQPSLKHYMKRPVGNVIKEPLTASSDSQKSAGILNFRVSEQELCLLKVQYMLVQDYVDYLQKIGLTLLKIHSQSNSQTYNLQYTPDCTTSPNAWLYVARPGGIIFAHVTFVEPYFSVRFLFWNSSQLSDHMYADQTIPETELADMREIELLKNNLIQQSHVHSFTYDFHLRMVSKYLTGGSQVLFNPGYNTKAFLIDFLQYYGCRPPYARNCIYEETAVFQVLRVNDGTIWDYFLSNDQHFGWNVVRLKTLNNRGDSEDEFMLIAKEQREIFNNQTYQLICIILKCPRRPHSTKIRPVELKLYVLMVSEDIKHPLPDNTILTTDHSPKTRIGDEDFSEQTSFINDTVLPSSVSSPSIVNSKCGDDALNLPSSSSNGGEFTRIERQPVNSKSSQEAIEPANTSMDAHVSRNQSFGGMLDQLIAMSRNEIMNNVGLQPSTSKKSLKQSMEEQTKCLSKSASLKDNSLPSFRRRANSTDAATTQLSFKQFTLLQRCKPTQAGDMNEAKVSVNTRSMDGLQNSGILFRSVVGGSLTRLDYRAALNDVWTRSNRDGDFGFNLGRSTNTSASLSEFAIEKFPLGRHRENLINYVQKRNTDIVLLPEQITYVHYFSNQQRHLQHVLEESASIKKSELAAFVAEAERTCYVNELWKTLLSSKSSMHSTRQPAMFSASTFKHDSGEAAASSIKIPQIEMNPTEFDALLNLICIEALDDEEPRLKEILQNVNFKGLCAFLVQHYEKDKLYRYFERSGRRYFIVLNPSYLDSAMMLRDNPVGKGAELFIMFKNTDKDRYKKPNFASSAIHEQFEKLMNYVTTFVWITVLQHSPALKYL